MTVRLWCLALLACSRPQSSETKLALTSARPTCFDPAGHGAIPDDGISDRVAFQTAIDAAGSYPDGGTVCIDRGRWRIDRAPAGSYNRSAGISTHAHNVTIAGVGPESVFEVVGDQGASDVSVISIDPGATGITIRDLTIDTSAATNTSEQTHAIATSAVCSAMLGTCLPISDIDIRNVTFAHPKRGVERKGDCIRLLGGTNATRVDRVRLNGLNFAACARSGITIQRNVHALLISNSTFGIIGDTDIDSEPTGGPGDLNDTVVIIGNTFVDDPSAQGDHAITLGGIAGPMSGVVVTGNVFRGRGIGLYRTGNVVITGNVLDAKMKGLSGVIEVGNVCSGLIVANNTIRRTGSPGPMIRMTPHSGGFCTDVMIDHNQLVQSTPGHGIYMESVSRATVDHNAVTWTVPAVGFSAIYARAASAAVDHLVVSNNRVHGPVTYATLLSSSPYSFGGNVRITGNMASGTTYGLHCTGAGGFRPITSYGNTTGARVCAGVTFATGQ